VAQVVDSHAHIFPHLGDASGFSSITEHRQYLQLYMATHGEPVRRLRDHVQIERQTLCEPPLVDPSRLRAVDFRAGQLGRFEWTVEGVDLYLQFFPPSLQGMESPAEFLLQQMARAGVDRAVLQNARPYGRLNRYFADAVRAYPERFIGLADIDESRADSPAEIDRLRHAVQEQGLRGLYYANRALFTSGYTHRFDDPRFDPLWEEVRALGIPVFWEVVGIPDPNAAADLEQEIARLDRWMARWPDIRCVWTHGFTPELLSRMPDALANLLRREQLLVELLWPIYWGRTHEYPFPELREPLQALHRRVGAERLIWGSDMPNVERNCTYRQSLQYLRSLADGWLPGRELDLVLGENVSRLFAPN
jgi:predicted TIM-barrel fold metal-dependent hydrolase